MASNWIRTSKVSTSNDSTNSQPFVSARSSMDDTDAQDMPTKQRQTSPALTDITMTSVASLCPSALSNDTDDVEPVVNWPGSPAVTPTDNGHPTREELVVRSWTAGPNIPLQVIKYTIGRRELAMQSQHNAPFDAITPRAFVHPPLHTPQTETLKAWHKLIAKTPQSLPYIDSASESIEIKLGFGPLGWDQIWGCEFVDLDKVMQYAGYNEWWLRRSEETLILCLMSNKIQVYGAEVRFPYGHDIIRGCEELGTKKVIHIPADEYVLIPMGKDILEWASQIKLQHDHWQCSPPFVRPFNPDVRVREAPTITLRYKNTHPEKRQTEVDAEEQGYWTKSWMTTDEVTVLSGEQDTTYLDTVIDGGPKPDPRKMGSVNRDALLDFWDLEGTRDAAIKWLLGMPHVRDRYRDGDEAALRRYIGRQVFMSVARAVRATPW